MGERASMVYLARETDFSEMMPLVVHLEVQYGLIDEGPMLSDDLFGAFEYRFSLQEAVGQVRATVWRLQRPHIGRLLSNTSNPCIRFAINTTPEEERARTQGMVHVLEF